jgi:hypothetical protein
MGLFPSDDLYPSDGLYPGLGPTYMPPSVRPPLRRDEVVWEPPGRGGQVRFGAFPPLVLTGLDGLLSSGADEQWRSAPGQWGESLTGRTVGHRPITVQVSIAADSRDELWALRRQVAGAFSAPPGRPGAAPLLGRFRLLTTEGEYHLEAACKVRAETWVGAHRCDLEVDVLAPDPRWRTPVEQHVSMEAGGGYSGPIAGPLYSIGGNVEQEVLNMGTAPAPVLVRIYGEVTGAAITLLDTGEQLKVRDTYTLAEGDQLRIFTGAVVRSVDLITPSGTSPAARHMDMSATTFFELPPGVSTVRFDGFDNPSGRAVVSWMPHWAGL